MPRRCARGESGIAQVVLDVGEGALEEHPGVRSLGGLPEVQALGEEGGDQVQADGCQAGGVQGAVLARVGQETAQVGRCQRTGPRPPGHRRGQ